MNDITIIIIVVNIIIYLAIFSNRSYKTKAIGHTPRKQKTHKEIAITKAIQEIKNKYPGINVIINDIYLVQKPTKYDGLTMYRFNVVYTAIFEDKTTIAVVV